jgi:hypothetical protein
MDSVLMAKSGNRSSVDVENQDDDDDGAPASSARLSSYHCPNEEDMVALRFLPVVAMVMYGLIIDGSEGCTMKRPQSEVDMRRIRRRVYLDVVVVTKGHGSIVALLETRPNRSTRLQVIESHAKTWVCPSGGKRRRLAAFLV